MIYTDDHDLNEIGCYGGKVWTAVLSLNNYGAGVTSTSPYVIVGYTTLSGTFDTIQNNTGILLNTSFGTNGVDYNYLGGNQIAVQFVPEPTALGLLALGVLPMLRRRRRVA